MGPGQHRSLQWRPQQGHAVWARTRGSPGQHPDVLFPNRERYYITTVYCIIMMFSVLQCIEFLYYIITLYYMYIITMFYIFRMKYKRNEEFSIGESYLLKKIWYLYNSCITKLNI